MNDDHLSPATRALLDECLVSLRADSEEGRADIVVVDGILLFADARLCEALQAAVWETWSRNAMM